MTKREPRALALGLLLLLTGCATPPLCVVPVGTIQNEVTLVYSYGRASPFRLESPLVEIVALVPRASGNDATAASQYDAATAAARITSVPAASSAREQDVSASISRKASKGTQDEQDAQSELRRTDAMASREEKDAASSVAQSTARACHGSAITHALQEDRSEHATTQEEVASASEKSLAQRSSIAASEYAESRGAELHHSHAGQRFASARIYALIANASSSWSTTLPLIRTWATKHRVVVGDRFDYVVEISNESSLDLVFAEVEDVLDHRLSVNASCVRAIPPTKLDVDLVGQRLSVGFTHGIPRGQIVRIIIPAMLKTDIAD
jgi:hypothetical protein